MSKEIVIHAGLPKTGTSAVQRWLRTHRVSLGRAGIRYPQHPVDDNGVGPGNLNTLLIRVKNGQHVVSPQRIGRTLDSFSDCPQGTLLLSSEFFAPHVQALAEHLPGHTRFVIYVRDPVELLESNYNQAVKRKHHRELFDPGQALGRPHLLPYLQRIPQLIAAGVNLTVRPYHESLFKGGHLLYDLFGSMGLRIHARASFEAFGRHRPINPSYSLHALEFKRSINHLPANSVPQELDQILQRYPEGPRSYSVIPPDVYADLRQRVDEDLLELRERGVASLEPLRDLLRDGEQRSVEPQRVTGDAVVAVANYVRQESDSVFLRLCGAVRESPKGVLPYPDLENFLRGVA